MTGALITDYLSLGSGAPSGAPDVVSGEWAFYQDTASGALYVWNLDTTVWDAVGGGGGSGTTVTSILDYAAVTDLQNNTAITASTWTDVNTNQSFTVGSGVSFITVSVSGNAIVGHSGGAEFFGVRVVIDSGGTPVNHIIGGGYTPGNYLNMFGGVNTIKVTGLSAGSHTIKVQVYIEGLLNTMYCQPSTRPNTDSLAILILQYQ